MSGYNNKLYKYYRNCSVMHATFVTLWLQVVQPLANVHETKWTPHVKRESDVAQSYTSSGMRWRSPVEKMVPKRKCEFNDD